MMKLLYSWMVGALALAAVAADTSGHSGSTRTYCVVDVSGGSTAAKYPISYLDDVPAGGWTDEYKTKKIVLRRINRPSGVYYAGVFEVTEAQWANVMGGSSTSTRPKGSVSYNTIRGDAGTYNWPSSDAVSSTSFMGRIRTRTGLGKLDLPSEAEWEYAARAGVTTDWLCGDSAAGLGNYAWYSANSGSQTHPVGTLRANAWGLYDVHGNVWEWCLDRHSNSGGYRVQHGGALNNDASYCAFAYRSCGTPSGNWSSCGFRLFCRGEVVVNPDYCVIDVSGGTDAANYPISYLDDVPAGGWTDEYKTDRIVLRRINKPTGVYYAGVFEVTETQWIRVMGGSIASTKPKVYATYNAIRGDAGTYDWPSSDAVAADSFIGRLRAKTGLAKLDLPSEEEWEYAARAGVTTKWLCGDSAAGLGNYAWYKDNSDGTKHPVGMLRANAWGLYDVHGNVWEWCLDSQSSDTRVVCGGGFSYDASYCAFAYRTSLDPSNAYSVDGFRLFCRGETPVVSPIAYENLRGAAHANPATYAEGTALAFSAPGAVEGYTFTGWTPAAITAETTGAQTVRANWRVNAYRIVYAANGGTGETAPTDCAYDADAAVAESAFVREGYIFRGWATEEGGEVVYAPGAAVRNLTSNDGGVVTLYAVWEAEAVEAPVITPADGTVFRTASCTVTITCATTGATIYCTTNGRTPRPTEANRYTGPFEVTGTTTVIAYAVRDERESELAEATLTYVEPEPLTLENALDEKKLAGVTTGGDAAWTPVEDTAAKSGESVARSGAVGMEQSSWLEATVHGRGTLTFWWKTSCEPDPRGRYTYDHVTFAADGEDRAKLDGETDWRQMSVTFGTDGAHTLRWTYSTDDWEESGYQDCAWVDGVSWTGSAAPAPAVPGIVGDADATVTGDAESGFTVTPSAESGSVEVSVPDGLDAAKVTVRVPPTVRTVKPHGAKVAVVRDGHDITAYLDIPAADADGAVDLASATVRADVAREPLDPDRGAVVDLGDASAPVLTTAPTKPGLRYTLREGATLDAMADGATKVGDGQPWTPAVTVKGGASGFYTIRVEK